MDRRSSHYRPHYAALAAALILTGCAGFRPEAKPDPVATICAIPYPPTLPRDEAVITPTRLGRWTSGVKQTLQDHRCPVRKN
jgi:hypothetical protein